MHLDDGRALDRKTLRKILDLMPPRIRNGLSALKGGFSDRYNYLINPERIYNTEFFAHMHEAKLAESDFIAKVVYDIFQPKSAIDVGCGAGYFLEALYRRGVETIGCDVSESALILSPKNVTIFWADLRRPLRFNRTFDICICFEVAEHIPRSASKTLVKSLVRLSNSILFTAAPPSQRGTGHINARPYEFWHLLFEKLGFRVNAEATSKVREGLAGLKHLGFLRDNFFCYMGFPQE